MRNRLLIFLVAAATVAHAQVGGHHSFGFLDMPAHARLSALGGVNVSLADRDVNFFHSNPALAGDTLNGMASAGYQFYVADIGHALITYAADLPKAGQFIAGVQHVRYGEIPGYDENGTATLLYHAGETALLVGRTHQIGNIRLGAAVKGVFSNVAGYRANALMIDLGGVFMHPSQDLTIGLAVKNVGIVLTEYRGGVSSQLPFDVQVGATLKPEHMPVRFSFTGYKLAQSGGLYDGGTEPATALQKIISHINAGAEILLHRNVNVLAGYNYLVHRTLKSETGNGGAGVCYGFSVAVRAVEFIFSRSAYTTGNAGYSFTLSMNTNQFLKRRKY